MDFFFKVYFDVNTYFCYLFVPYYKKENYSFIELTLSRFSSTILITEIFYERIIHTFFYLFRNHLFRLDDLFLNKK